MILLLRDSYRAFREYFSFLFPFPHLFFPENSSRSPFFFAGLGLGLIGFDALKSRHYLNLREEISSDGDGQTDRDERSFACDGWD